MIVGVASDHRALTDVIRVLPDVQTRVIVDKLRNTLVTGQLELWASLAAHLLTHKRIASSHGS
jgi:hypothetical protein